MKVLFFGLVAAAIFGSVFFLSRAFRRFGGRSYGPHGHFPYENARWQQPFLQQDHASYAQPLDPNWQSRPRTAPLGRRIEVL